MDRNKKNSGRRKTLKPVTCPNPLFEKWLTEWKEEAASRDSNLQYCFAKALSSLRKYPLPLKTGKECLILKHFGNQLCVKLDRKLIEYKTNGGGTVPSIQGTLDFSHTNAGGLPTGNIAKENVKKSRTEKKKNNGLSPLKRKGENDGTSSPKRKIQRPYLPAYRSGPYAILLTFLEEQKRMDYPGYMTKVEIQSKAQKLCDASFTKPDADSRYTAWSSMSALIKKGFISRNRSGLLLQFSLTKEGEELAQKLASLPLPTSQSLPSRSDFSSPTRSSSDKDISGHHSPYKLLDSFSSPAKSAETTPHHVSPDKLLRAPDFQTGSSIGSYTSTVSVDHGIKQREVFIDLTEDETHEDIAVTQIASQKSAHVFTTLDSQSSISNSNSQNTVPSLSSGSASDVVEQLVFLPGSFRVILLVDIQETNGKERKDNTVVKDLTELNVELEVRHLKVGDYAWVCRDAQNKELLLPYIAERKRMDDLSGSIKDGRFHEQKFRLRQCGLQNVIYLIEKYGSEAKLGLPPSTLHQAIANTQLIDGFHVKCTSGYRHSIEYLATLTKWLTDKFMGKTLFSCSKEELPNFDIEDDIASLMTFREFSKHSVKTKNFKVKEMFIKQLLQLRGLSVEKAVAITDIYPTPKQLIKAFKESTNGDMLLAKIKYGPLSRNIGPAISKALYQLYTKHDLN